MVFSTPQFALFFAVVLPVSWMLMPKPWAWKPFIIAASYYFYGSADVHYVGLLVFCTVWNQAFAHVIHRWGSRSVRWGTGLLTVALIGDLGLLGWFKYYGFFAQNVESFTQRLGLAAPLPLLQVALPIGISFFTFQAMSYVIDIKRGRYAPVRTIDFALYLSFFPHLIAGPIVRASELVPQFSIPRDPRRIEAVRAFGLITGGLIKKVVLADQISKLVDPVFESPTLHSRADVIAAIYGYAVQIYCDFSGYTDIAIGLALLMGFRFPANFNRPYTAVTLQDFWHRWHMTLSRWLRDYLYIGLGGNRKGRLKTYRNLMLTMLLGGLWHGAAWKFLLWGGMHGGGLAIERWWADRSGRPESDVRWPILRWFITFNLVCLAWVFFRADDLTTVQQLWQQLVTNTGETEVSGTVIAATLMGLLVQFVPRQPAIEARRIFGRLNPVLQGIALSSVLILTLAMITGQGVAPFIYFRF